MTVEEIDYLIISGLGFAKEKRLLNYYMSGNDAFRLKLWLKLDRLVPRLFEKKPQS